MWTRPVENLWETAAEVIHRGCAGRWQAGSIRAMKPTFADGPAPLRPVLVEPDELVRVAASLDGLSGALAREAPAATGLRGSPPGWAVGAAQAALAHDVTAHLAAVAADVDAFGRRLQVAGLSYADRDAELSRRLTAAGRR